MEENEQEVEQVEELEPEYMDDEIRQALEKRLERNEDYSTLKNLPNKKDKKSKQTKKDLSFEDFSKYVDKIEESKKPKKFIPSKLNKAPVENKRKFNPRFPPYKFEKTIETAFEIQVDKTVITPMAKGAWTNTLKLN